jgi:hypothetical protein
MSRDWKDYWPFRLKSEQRRFHGIPHEQEENFHEDALLRAAGSLPERLALVSSTCQPKDHEKAILVFVYLAETDLLRNSRICPQWH